MTVAPRSYLTAGVAVLGAGAIALSPIQPIPHQLASAPQKAVVSTLAVDLAAAIDPITPWVDLVKTSMANIQTIIGQQFDPGPVLPITSAMLNNWKVYLQELPDIPQIFNQILGNLRSAVTAPLDQNLGDPPAPTIPAISENTNNTLKVVCLGARDCGDEALTKYFATSFLALVPAFRSIVPAINTLSSPLSGALLGFAGPGLSAFVQLQESIDKILRPPLGANPLLNAINEVINLPANMLNAGLNGGKQLDLTPILEKLGPALGFTLPPGTKLGIATGGFLSPGVAMGGTDPDGVQELPFKGWSGTAWDSVSAEAALGDQGNAYITGTPVGTLATALGMRTTIANAITLPMPTSARAVAPAATEAAPSEDEVSASKVADVIEDAEKAQASKRQSRATSRADKADDTEKVSRSGRGTRR